MWSSVTPGGVSHGGGSFVRGIRASVGIREDPSTLSIIARIWSKRCSGALALLVVLFALSVDG